MSHGRTNKVGHDETKVHSQVCRVQLCVSLKMIHCGKGKGAHLSAEEIQKLEEEKQRNLTTTAGCTDIYENVTHAERGRNKNEVSNTNVYIMALPHGVPSHGRFSKASKLSQRDAAYSGTCNLFLHTA